MYREGAIKLPITEVFPLGEVAAAHRLIESRRSKGKVLLST
ncbi:MAG: zinc-binding dehydrogenase [Candidatus Korobacteraceae bacterium]